MASDDEQPLAQRRSLYDDALAVYSPATDERTPAPIQPQLAARAPGPRARRAGNVSVRRVVINHEPPNLQGSVAAVLDANEDSGNEADSENSDSSIDVDDQTQVYQSRFQEDFETSASPEEIRRLTRGEIPDSQEDPADLNLEIPDSQEDPADLNLSDVEGEETLPDAREDLSHVENNVQAANDPFSDTQEISSEDQEDLSDAEDHAAADDNPFSDSHEIFSEGQEDLSEAEENVQAATNDFRGSREDLPEFEEDPSDTEDFSDARSGPQYTFHTRGINCIGRLPIEHPRFADYDEMEEPATQESTQPFLDPRRLGDRSDRAKDEADIICTLHPTSPAAFKAVELVAEITPQHVLQNHNFSHKLEGIDNDPGLCPGQDRASTGQPRTNPEANDRLPALASGTSAQDIALRISSHVKDICLGWTFGRSPKYSDILIADGSQTSSISSVHFRIYLNDAGVLMLEDNSMNGTWVDDAFLCKKGHGKVFPTRRMINPGSTIDVITVNGQKDGIRFLVMMPRRDHWASRYAQKLSEYIGFVAQMKRQKEAAAKAATDGNGLMMPPPVAMIPLGNGNKEDTPLSETALSALAAGTAQYSHGMHWTGGDKYNVVGYIGKGAFALVYRLATKQDGELVAAKQLEKRRFMKDGILDQKIHNELLIMKDLSHPNIVKYVEHEDRPHHLYIIMEYVPEGDLTTYIHSDSVMPEFLGQSLARQICSALDYLHVRKITHRDIKPDNILVASTDPFVVKLSDFGLSKVLTNERDFLKTFCGTLLYCAPEVYPGYDSWMAGNRGKRRRHEPPPTTSPYKQSVDIWAFAAVLYHLLCGTPAWTGSAEDRGALMLETVMTQPVDYDRLRHVGVSEDGIDFLSRMLVLDPRLRSTEVECLRHPWLKIPKGSWDEDSVEMDAEAEGLLTIDDDQEQELDASQLSLNDRPAEEEIDDSDEELVSDVDELLDTRESKRFKAQHEECSSDVTYPFLPNMQGVQPPTESAHPTGNRLFGEIGASALRSSGVLGYDAHAALQMTTEGNRDEGASASGIHNSTDYSVTSDGLAQHRLQYPHTLPGPHSTGSAPSLFGTEALVGELNMASPESGVSGPSASTSAAPTTPKTRGPSPLSPEAAGSKRSSQSISSPIEHSTPKRAKSNPVQAPPQPSAGSSTQRQQITSTSHDAGKDKNQLGESWKSTSKAQNNKASKYKAVQQLEHQETTEATKDIGVLTNDPNTHDTQDSNQGSSGSNHSASASTTKEATEFTKPLPRLGKLTPTPGSIPTPTIKLEKRVTTYGRDPGSDFQHKDGMDTRIPKCALDLIFWRPGLEAQLAENPDLDWTAFDDLHAIVSTRTRHAILVNGVELRKGDGHWNFGKLYTGDVITIFPPIGPDGKEAQFLRFNCEFKVGASKEARKEGSVFMVEKEEEKFLQWQMRKSREASRANSETGTAGEGASGAGGEGATSSTGNVVAATAAAANNNKNTAAL